MNEKDILQSIKASYQNILKHKLVGIYVHGSIAFGCFNWDKSDIDFLVVINDKLSQEEKEALISEILTLDKECPVKGIEMSVILDSVCRPFSYPTPYELHFSNSHKEKCKANLHTYCKDMNGLDKDLAAHITVINKVGIVLCGEEIINVFATVHKEDYIDSIYYDIENAKDEIKENPMYFVLNLCRVLAYLENDIVLSKMQGGEWGIENLPSKYSGLIGNAIEMYTGDGEINEKDLLEEFATYMLGRICDKYLE